MNCFSREQNAGLAPAHPTRRLRVPIAKVATGRSLREFQPLLPGEQCLLRACRLGEWAVLGASLPEAPDDALRVRPAFLRFLMLGGDDQAPVHEHGVQLAGAYVEGVLDLGGCHIPHKVDFKDCKFTHQLLAQDVRVGGLMNLDGSHLCQGIDADWLQCDGGLHLENGFKATGEVRLLGAQIGGNLQCSGGQFEVKGGNALLADAAVVKGSVLFNAGFKATGQVRLPSAQISGRLTCSGGRFEVEKDSAFLADGVVVRGGVFLSDGFNAIGQVRLPGAQIHGPLDCSGGKFEVEKDSAFLADGVVVKGGVFLSAGFKATGEVRLPGAQIDGPLDCSGGHFEVKGGDALLADGALVKGSVFFSDGFKVTGQVRLPNAQIGGSLVCRGGQFEVKDGAALSADRAIVKGIWFFDRLEQPALVGVGHMQVSVLADALESWAEGSTIDGLCYGSFGGDAPTQAKARLEWLGKQPATHRGETNGGEHFRPQPWRQLQRVLREMGHLEEACQIGIAFEQQMRKIGRIGQSPRGTWAAVAWSKRAIARTLHAWFGWLSGYGYRPMRLAGYMVLVWLVWAGLYWWLALPPHDAIGPSDPLVFQNERYASCVPGSAAAAAAAANGAQHAGNWYLCEPLPAAYSTFSPLAYSLDIILPLVDLGQEKAWGSLIATPRANVWEEMLTLSSGHWVRVLAWLETLFGWVGSLLLVGIVSGLARRSED